MKPQFCTVGGSKSRNFFINQNPEEMCALGEVGGAPPELQASPGGAGNDPAWAGSLLALRTTLCGACGLGLETARAWWSQHPAWSLSSSVTLCKLIPPHPRNGMIRSTLKGSFKGSPEIMGPCGLERALDRGSADHWHAVTYASSCGFFTDWKAHPLKTNIKGY